VRIATIAATFLSPLSSPEAVVMRKQGLQHTTEEPLLLSLLHRYIAHGDPMLSPRIAAKAKSSIAAKPGGEEPARVGFALAHKEFDSCLNREQHYSCPAFLPGCTYTKP